MTHTKMLKLRKRCIKKQEFLAFKEAIDINDVDIEHIVASSKYPIENINRTNSLVM